MSTPLVYCTSHQHDRLLAILQSLNISHLEASRIWGFGFAADIFEPVKEAVQSQGALANAPPTKHHSHAPAPVSRSAAAACAAGNGPRCLARRPPFFRRIRHAQHRCECGVGPGLPEQRRPLV
eukprot:scaffold22134_cov112-Isochrysis_galbana.AAC.2